MDLNVDQLLKISDNKFLLSNALGKRAKQITDGSLPYVDDFNASNPIITAMKEIATGKVKIKTLSGPKPREKDAVKDEFKSRLASLAKEQKSEKKSPPKKKK
jgi:DNA-directed RNA polymerase subunit K/omega